MINVDLHNEFDIVVRDAKTMTEKHRAKAYNMILNQFWNAYLATTNTSTISYIHAGSGVSAPAATDTSLTSFLIAKSATRVRNDFTDFWQTGVIKIIMTARIEASEIPNTTIGEIGFASGSGSNTLRTKCRLQDQNGNPITIPKTDLDVIDIYGTFFVKIPSDPAFTFWTVDDTNNSGMLARLLMLASGSHYMQPTSFLPNPQGTEAGYSTNSGSSSSSGFSLYSPATTPPAALNDAAYISPTFDIPSRKMTITWPGDIAANSNNWPGGIAGFTISGIYFRVPSENIIQNVIQKEVIGTGDGTKTKYNTEFPLIRNNETFHVYVNDVEVSVANVLYDRLKPETNIVEHVNVVDWNKAVTSNKKLTKNPVIGKNGYSNQNDLGGWVVFENPYYSTNGITSINVAHPSSSSIKQEIYVSNDMTNWILAATITGANPSIPAQYKNYRYWKVYTNPTFTLSNVQGIRAINVENYSNEKLITLSSPAPSGSTITCTYQPNVLAKNSSRIIRSLKFEMIFNEYTP